MGIERFHAGPTFEMLAQRSLLTVIWRTAPALVEVQEFRTIAARLRRTEVATAMANVVVGGTPKFSATVVRESSLALTENAPHFRATAHLILMEGFAGAAVRAFFSTVVLTSRTSVPSKVFGESRVAGKWLVDACGQDGGFDWTELELAEWFERCRAPLPTP